MLLEKAFGESQKLTSHDQDAFTALIIEEMIAERTFDDAFASNQDQLASLADEALAEVKAGKAKPLQFN